MEAVVVDGNLMTASRTAAQLRAAGYSIKIANPAEETLCEVDPQSLVVINYGPYTNDFSAAADLTTKIRHLCPDGKVIGHVSHGVVADLKGYVLPAGCNLLVANSVASSRLIALVERLNSAPPHAADVEEPEE